ncbi:Protein CBG26065 [Caenorhabditis briggsae]|uniref:Protein CBG26065 n=1 Tax=Caenorhabditis briggsae TaxID=6238 RepID=B6ILP8_CAEBR|nr:Protein CBG26065 [Caenorhabditis briggsae]CAS00828.1 Protein CBG26065 [Caenorhabditis briggsae]
MERLRRRPIKNATSSLGFSTTRKNGGSREPSSSGRHWNVADPTYENSRCRIVIQFFDCGKKMEIPENLQVSENIGISPIGFTNNFKKPPKTKRTRRSHCEVATQILQAYFETSQHPSGLQMAQFAEATGLNNKQVKAWTTLVPRLFVVGRQAHLHNERDKSMQKNGTETGLFG